MPMTTLADDLLRQSLGSGVNETPVLHVCEDAPVQTCHQPDAA